MGKMRSAIPIALLCMIGNWSERKQGSGPKGNKVLQNIGGLLLVHQSYCPFICSPQAFSSLNSALSGLKSTLSSLKSVSADFRSKREDFRPERADFRSQRADSWPERADFRPEIVNFRPENVNFRPWKGRGPRGDQLDKRMDEQKSPCVQQDFIPFRTAAKKRGKKERFSLRADAQKSFSGKDRQSKYGYQ